MHEDAIPLSLSFSIQLAPRFFQLNRSQKIHHIKLVTSGIADSEVTASIPKAHTGAQISGLKIQNRDNFSLQKKVGKATMAPWVFYKLTQVGHSLFL